MTQIEAESRWHVQVTVLQVLPGGAQLVYFQPFQSSKMVVTYVAAWFLLVE
jgi:hypothetical protein